QGVTSVEEGADEFAIETNSSEEEMVEAGESGLSEQQPKKRRRGRRGAKRAKSDTPSIEDTAESTAMQHDVADETRTADPSEVSEEPDSEPQTELAEVGGEEVTDTAAAEELAATA